MLEAAVPAARKGRIPWSQETRAIAGVGAAVLGVGAAVIGVFLTVSLSLNNRITAERNALAAEMQSEHARIRAEMQAEHAQIGAEIRQTQEMLQAILREILRLHTSQP